MSDRLRLLAVQFAGLAGMIHVGLGLREWSAYAVGGFLVPPDIRVPLWTVSGFAVLAGVVAAAYRPAWRRPVYAALAVVLVGYAAAYYSWHLTGHQSLFFLGDPQLHGAGPLAFLLDHTFAGPVQFVALLTELGGATALVLLLARDRTETQ
jgi:hypothetical protein